MTATEQALAAAQMRASVKGVCMRCGWTPRRQTSGGWPVIGLDGVCMVCDPSPLHHCQLEAPE